MNTKNLKHNKSNLEKQITSLNARKQEYTDKQWSYKNIIEQLSEKINEKFKSEKILFEKYNVGEENKIDFSSHVSMIISQNFDLGNAKNDFIQIKNNFLGQTSEKNNEIKQMEENLIVLKSERLKLKDKNNEIGDIMSQMTLKLQDEERMHETEKEKGKLIINQKNEEIRKENEDVNKCHSLLLEKEHELEELKKIELSLEAKYQEDEDAAEKYIKGLEEIFAYTIKEVEKTKIENVKKLRKTYKDMNVLFEDVKKKP